MKRALITLTIGDGYVRNYKEHCEHGWREYAQRNGFDVVQICESLDDSARARARSPAWQKCLVLSHPSVQKYDQVCWVDSDVLINPSSPNIFDGIPIDRIGAVDWYATPDRESFRIGLQRQYDHLSAEGIPFIRDGSASDYHRAFGLINEFNEVVQTGVLVLSPRHHRELLERVYSEYEDKGGACWHYEMRPLSYEILNSGVVHWISPRFNMLWAYLKTNVYPFLDSPDGKAQRIVTRFLKLVGLAPRSRSLRMKCATTSFLNSYFLHFAGSASQMKWVDQTVTSMSQI